MQNERMPVYPKIIESLQLVHKQELLGNQFNVYGTVDDPLFRAKEVAVWIEHTNSRMMLSNIDEDEKVVNNVYTHGGMQEQWFLTEDGLLEVLMQSRKPIAKKFKKEVKIILKQIRRTGQYSAVPLDTFGQIQLLSTGTIELNNRVDSLENIVHEQLTIDFGQQQVLQKLKAKRVYHLWDNDKGDKQMHDSKNKLFGLFGRNLKDAFNVSSYRDILKKDFDEAVNFINGWRPMI